MAQYYDNKSEFPRRPRVLQSAAGKVPANVVCRTGEPQIQEIAMSRTNRPITSPG